MTGSSSEEEELVQDAFVLLWRKAAQFNSARASVGAWLFAIARNLRVDRNGPSTTPGQPWTTGWRRMFPILPSARNTP